MQEEWCKCTNRRRNGDNLSLLCFRRAALLLMDFVMPAGYSFPLLKVLFRCWESSVGTGEAGGRVCGRCCLTCAWLASSPLGDTPSSSGPMGWGLYRPSFSVAHMSSLVKMGAGAVNFFANLSAASLSFVVSILLRYEG